MTGRIKRKINKFFLKKDYDVIIECLRLSLKGSGNSVKGDDQDYYFLKNGIVNFLNHGDLLLKKFENSQYLKRRKFKIKIVYFFQGILEARQQLRYARMMLAINKDDNDERINMSKNYSTYIIRSYPEIIEQAKQRTKKIYLIVSSVILLNIILLLNRL
ncbi:hypothetical protein [Providencia rettgeri]|uniref:hypothetical protein n=1 Tax=Providencia rettgeri TaxID=587 RepID=UPI0024BB087D|nr:hypothetical protein [Providencia rettgeri]WHT81931.1 hypothetical protein KOL65_22095 [Providencia rettgeri]